MNEERGTMNAERKKSVGMKRIWKIMGLVMVVMVVGWGTAVSAHAQDNPITATVDRNSLTTDDTLVLTVAVEGGDADPQLPFLDGFDIVATGSSTQISIVNGSMSTSKSYQYRLQPTRPGDLTIPAINVVINGVTYGTAPIAVQVTQGSGAAQPGSGFAQPAPAPANDVEAPTELNGQDLFVEAVVDNSAPYQGETFTYIFRFYQAVNLFRDPNYAPPSFSGFWTDDDPQQTDYTVQAANRTYRVSEVQTTLAPTAAGQVTIEPTTLNIPGSLFEGSRTLQTYPVTVDVQPWPQGAPADFKGAVGKFTLNAKVDTTETRVNEPVTLQVILAGEGNLNTAGDPVWTEGAEWRAFDQQATLNTQKQNGKISGQKVFERLLIPTQAGELTIPAISYSYFDPETAVYTTLTTDPIIINVAEGNGGTAVVGSAPADAPTAVAPAAPAFASDIHGLKLAPEKAATTALTGQPGFWLLWLIPLALVAVPVAYRRRQAYKAQNSDKIRSQQAAKQANLALQTAQKTGQEVHAAALQIFHDYLAAKLNRSVAGLTRRDLLHILRAHGAGDDLLAEVQTFLDRCEYGRFAPTAQTDTTLWTDTAALIGKLEEEIGD